VARARAVASGVRRSLGVGCGVVTGCLLRGAIPLYGGKVAFAEAIYPSCVCGSGGGRWASAARVGSKAEAVLLLSGSVVGAFGRGPARLMGLRGLGLACPSGAFAGDGLRGVVVSAPAEHPSPERPDHGPCHRCAAGPRFSRSSAVRSGGAWG